MKNLCDITDMKKRLIITVQIVRKDKVTIDEVSEALWHAIPAEWIRHE